MQIPIHYAKKHVTVVRKGRGNQIIQIILLFQLENAILQEKESEIHVEYQQLQDKNIALTSEMAELTSNLNEANGRLAAKQEDLTSCMNCLKVCVNSSLTM